MIMRSPVLRSFVLHSEGVPGVEYRNNLGDEKKMGGYLINIEAHKDKFWVLSHESLRCLNFKTLSQVN